MVVQEKTVPSRPISLWQYRDQRTGVDSRATLGDDERWGVLMAVNTKKKNRDRKAKKNDYYERTVVRPAARLIAAITNKANAARKVAAG